MVSEKRVIESEEQNVDDECCGDDDDPGCEVQGLNPEHFASERDNQYLSDEYHAGDHRESPSEGDLEGR